MDGFKNLIVWQKAMQLVRVVYEVARAFPADERYALTDQLRRAAVSIAVEVGLILGTLLKKYGALRSSPSPLAFTSKR